MMPAPAPSAWLRDSEMQIIRPHLDLLSQHFLGQAQELVRASPPRCILKSENHWPTFGVDMLQHYPVALLQTGAV